MTGIIRLVPERNQVCENRMDRIELFIHAMQIISFVYVVRPQVIT